MQYLKSTDSKYDKVLANIFNYIFEKEENKLNLDESTCKFDLTSLQGPVLILFRTEVKPSAHTSLEN